MKEKNSSDWINSDIKVFNAIVAVKFLRLFIAYKTFMLPKTFFFNESKYWKYQANMYNIKIIDSIFT